MTKNNNNSSNSFFYIIEQFQKLFNLYGFNEIDLPFIENADLYFRTAGVESDVCNKELFEVRRYKDEFKNLVLRPEGTAGCINYVINENLMQNNKLLKFAYVGKMFRYNRPQKGRLRQFTHLGLELIGSQNIYYDFEIIKFCNEFLKSLNLNFSIEINSIGIFSDRLLYKEELKNHFQQVGIECNKDPLKILDKLENFNKVPLLKINEASLKNFNELQKMLNLSNISFKINPYLIRGLDYYNDLVFEFKIDEMAILGGGRYDSLASQINPKFNIPSIGCGIGLERVSLFFNEKFENKSIPIISIDSSFEYNEKICNILRLNNYSTFIFHGNDFSKSLNYLSKKYRFIIITGKNEEEKNIFILKDLILKTQKEIFLSNNLNLNII